MRHGNTTQDHMALLKACTKKKDLYKGTRLHDDIIKRGLLEKNPYLGSSLINMYARCGMLTKAQQVLEEIPTRNVVCWNALISGYSREGKIHEALNGLNQMKYEGFCPNGITYTSILNACGKTRAIHKGKQIHDEILNRGLLEDDIMLGTALVDMYAKCGFLCIAQKVLKEQHIRDVVSWSALITGFAQQGQGHEALYCFEEMQSEHLSPDAITLASILKACGTIGAIDKGKHIHEEIVRLALLGDDIVLGNALVDMYVKFGMLEKAREVLEDLPYRNVITWSTLIAGFAQHGRGHEALHHFQQMQSEGISPNPVTLICVLNACGSMGAINKGKQLHSEILSRGLLDTNMILTTALVDMYAKCGFFAKAQQVLEEHAIRHMISWNVIIGGYAQLGRCAEAFNCFEKICREGLAPDPVTFICILKACGNSGAIEKGKIIHEDIMSRGFLVTDSVLGTSVLDMYAKCGMLTKAAQVLDELSVRNVVSWNALISGFAQEGKGHEALHCFESMQCEGLSPDEVTFQCVLNACSHSGLLNEIQILFGNMSEKYNIIPRLQHLAFMVTVFGCAGYFDQVMSVIKMMPSSDNSAVWLAVLDVSRIWGNSKLGILAFDQLMQLDNSCAISYIVMADIFVKAGMQDDAEKVEAIRLKYAAF